MGNSYCDFAPGQPWHGPYHDREYGFPIRRDAALLERLALEINQAGLSWLTVLKKRRAFRRAFTGFDPETVARYGKRDRARLLADARIIRNRLKVDAVIENARRILDLRDSHGSFAKWLDAHHPRPLPSFPPPPFGGVPCCARGLVAPRSVLVGLGWGGLVPK